MVNKYFTYLIAILAISLFTILLGDFVIILALALVLFEKCFLGRIAIIPGIEFTTLSIILVTLKYGIFVGILFVIFVPLVIPTIINMLIGEKGVVNPNFQFIGIGFGNILDLLCVIIVSLLKWLDIIWIMLILLLFKHSANTVADRLKGVTFSMSNVGIPINFLFNLSLIYFFHSFWIGLLA
jgi:hypothetical protein